MAGDSVKKKASVKTVILLVFVAFTALIVLLVGSVFYMNWKSSTETYIGRIANSLSDEIVHQVDLFAEVPLKLNDSHLVFLENDIIDITDSYERDLFFYNALSTARSEQIYSFSYGTIEGYYYGARKNTTNTIEIMINDRKTEGHSWYYSVDENKRADMRVLDAGAFDPRKRDWYKIAVENGGPVFSPIYPHFIMEDLAISSVSPVYGSGGTLKGVIGTHVTLGRINDFLREISEPFGGYAYIVESNGLLVGNSLRNDNFKYQEDEIIRTRITDLNHDAANSAFQTYLSNNESTGIVSDEFGERYVEITAYNKYGLDWLIITIVPVDSFLQSSFDSILFTFLVSIIAFLLSIFLYFRVTKKYFAPFYQLIEVVEEFAAGNYSKRIENVTEGEFGKLATSYNHMADVVSETVYGLEKDVINRTEELEEEQNRLNSILNSTAEGIVGIEPDGICMFCNRASLDLLGYEMENELIGKHFHSLVHRPEDDDMTGCTLINAISEQKNVHSHQDIFFRSDGTSFDVEVHMQIIKSKEGVSGAVLSFTDITERIKSHEKVEFFSKHDSLTGLYNRLYFEEFLKQYQYEELGPVSIIMCDVNGLKLTNDIFGHKAGDQLIIAAADTLRKITSSGGLAARVGGDEFILLLSNCSPEKVSDIADEIKSEFSNHDFFAFKGTISVGFAVQKSLGTTYENLISQAEDMMYMDKAINNKQMRKEAIQDLISKLHALDPFEREHSLNVANLSYELAKYIKLSKDDCKRIKEAGFLHDIGKITLSLKDLEKEVHFFSQNDADHFEHSITGYRILNAFEDTLDIAEVILFHHERWDGQGYPRNLKDTEIPLFSRIIAIVEAFDELTGSNGTSGMSEEDAFKRLEALSGIYFDPDLLEAFIEMRRTS